MKTRGIRKLKKQANENDDPEDRGFEKTIQEESKQWTEPRGDGTRSP